MKKINEIFEDIRDEAGNLITDELSGIPFNRKVKSESLHRDKKKMTEPQIVFRKAFIEHGYVSDPQTAYHLEIRPTQKSETNLDELLLRLKNSGFDFKKSGERIYIKKHSVIADFLTFIGARVSAAEFMNAQIYRGTAGRIVKIQNFEVANIDKTAKAVAAVTFALNKITGSNNLHLLTDDQISAAESRIEYLEYSLAEVAERVGVSKSTLDRRIRKVIELAEKLD